jgi:hypothetical protein
MEFTNEQREQVQHEYAARRKRQLIMTVPFLVLVLGLMFSEKQGSRIMGLPAEQAAPILLGLMGLFLVFSFRNWRCPGCSKYLGKAFNPRHCQSCGVQLHA